jgi:two-component system cell cycle sensor histidine kinase/response regulator CckA
MSLTSRLYIAFVISLGSIALGYGLYHWESSHLSRFLCYLVLAIPASCFKVTLPGVRMGTMSVLFLFLLGATVQLSLPETLVIGVVCVAAQSLWHSRFGVRVVQLVFSMAVIAIAIAATDFGYHAVPFLPNPLRLALAVTIFFLVNTFPIAIVIALTEGRPLREVWVTSYLWCFPYYLVGAGIVNVIAFSNQLLDWQSAILILPVAYVVYRSYRLYVDQLQHERQRAEEERKHAVEIAAAHAETVEALESAMMANARLDAVFRASPLALLTLSKDGKVTGWNRTAEQMFGWSHEEAHGQPLPVPAGRTEAIIHDILDRTLEGESISGMETKQWHKDGRAFDASIWTATLGDSEGVSGIVAMVADVSVRKRLEEQLRLSQKMEAVGRLAGGVAHDFNNLLTVINGYSSMLINTIHGHPYAVSQAEEILGAGSRAAELVAQLLTFSRRQMIKPRPLELNQVVRDVERMLKRVIGEHIELRTNLRPDTGWIHADLNQMEGVLLNLSTNARDAMSGGGVLTIETSRVDVGGGNQPPHTDLEAGSYVCLVIRDTGHGMDNETKQLLFEPFYTTKEQGKGTGLGLSSVYGSVEQNRGRIFVWSELGKGSELSIYLPRIESPEGVDATPKAAPEVERGTGTILLVEDETSVRRMLREALSRAGYRVWEAGNGAEALEQWAREIEMIDLVVTDVIMPMMNGLQLMAELRKRRPSIKVVCMSGHSEELIRQQGGPDAPFDLLQKPFLPDALVRKVREILEPRDTFSERRGLG